jgi:hypothetical protein
MNVAAVFITLSAFTLTACVTDSNRCLPGFEFAPQYDACLAKDGGDESAANDAGSPAAEAAPSEAASPEDAPSEGGEAGAGTGLGNACNASTDCTGSASYCLKSPTAPTDPGVCSITPCTAAECTSAYACCDCSAASLSSLQAYPPGVCIPSADEAQLTALGCKCL